MPSSPRATSVSRNQICAVIVGAFLMFCSCYGFWTLIVGNSNLTNDATRKILFFEINLAAVPLILLVFVATRFADAAGHRLASQAFQVRIDQLQKRLNTQDDFFRLVTDYTSSSLTVFNTHHEYWFVNAKAAQKLTQTEPNFLGKRCLTVLGPSLGIKVEKNLQEVAQAHKPLECIHKGFDQSGQPQYIQASYQPLDAFGEFPGGVMLREDDVTTLLVERELREDMLRQVIATLVAVVDRRDPYAAGHSSRVGKLSGILAAEMNLDSSQGDAAEIAGTLMNFGKVLISRSILTKTDLLTPDELQRVRDGILSSADILSMIDFRSPVVPTLRQVLERLDGTGVPLGLQGNAILITARIVAVANAFVAMVSPRAYRSGIDPLAAIDRMSQDAGSAFDASVIAALRALLAKRGDKIDWLLPSKGLN